MKHQKRKEGFCPSGLYHPEFEHDNCGIGGVVNLKGVPSHKVVEDAIKIVENLGHRAGQDADGKTGDGVGIMLQISHKFFSKIAKKLELTLENERDYGVGMFFFPQNELERNRAKKLFEIIAKKEGVELLGWREVPTNPEILGEKALACMPCIMQAFLKRPSRVDKGLAFDRLLYVIRRTFEQGNETTYVASLSCRTIVYKGMFLVKQLREFYLDLQDEDYESALGLVHSRFSTNTNPSWERAHPNRFILHNGEINTIKGNADLMSAREETMSSEFLKGDMHKVLPFINAEGSDSAILDNTLEFMVMSGMELPLSVMITIPEPWSNDKSISQEKRDFYQYYATMLESWDGPAAVLFSDGDVVGATLDRNGLRPARYYITKDGFLILASEVGVVETEPENILKKDRLRPGKMLLVDITKGELIDDTALKQHYATRQPYGEWLDKNLISLHELSIPNQKIPEYTTEELRRLQKAFGYSYEDIKGTILPMAKNGQEAITAMGVDSPLSVLSERKTPLFDYFKQRFAQVTNPPIDAVREEIVTSTSVYLGSHGNLLQEHASNCKALKINNPILTNTDLLKIKNMHSPGFHVEVIPTVYYKSTSLENALEQLFVSVDRAYRNKANIIILSDRDIDEYHIAIPSLLAVSAVSKYLVRTKKRTAIDLIIESAEPRETHHFAALLGYGASAVNPYLALECIRELIHDNSLDKDFYAAVEDYNNAVLHGIIKIASKMGISTIRSYQSSQMFEAVGINRSVIDKYFTGTVSRIGGIGLREIQQDIESLHSSAFDPLDLMVNLTPDSVGSHKFRSGKEEHLYNPRTIHLLQKSTKQGDYALFKEYSKTIDTENSNAHLRGLLEFRFPEKGISIDEVESVDSIVKRFKTGAMSYGSISQEAHETLAVAMNILGGKSNSGEGGESDERLAGPDANGINRCSAIKQVASGRFGVTSEYLMSAKEIQIKMAQGAKPGEGGHLPGGKVYPWVAKTRHSTPGVGLISPPPHHDIYSIEDLAQLIYDLKNANRKADISVKLVAEAGVGTIAAGVAKAGAQVILISGYDGGTGAAPRSSIYNTGLPWELGLAETHQTLILNGLRQKVRLETDGKLMNGRDIAIAAMLGAEEFGFATAPLVTMGCVMMRVCNLDTCPVGIATQNPELRKRFKGKPEYVVNFMRFVAQELREYMAKLGIRTVNELVGRSDLLKMKQTTSTQTHQLDLTGLLSNPEIKQYNVAFDPKQIYNFELENTVDEKVLLKKFKNSIATGQKKTVSIEVCNVDRSVGTILGSEITKKFRNSLSDDTYTVNCNGNGGQSFGAFIPKGLTLSLSGDSNDYFGKGLSGGILAVAPPSGSKFKQDENIIVGNVALYGATSGQAYINGVAGERFCVRNSGATAVVEGVGDHGCEYMTGGVVAVLGNTGKNFAAGMSGGIAYVLDEKHNFYKKLNKELVSLEDVTHMSDITTLKTMIEQHVKYTNSEKGKIILENFSEYLPKFKKVLPYDYDKMLRTIVAMEKKGLSDEDARIEAFYAMKNGGAQ